MSEALVGRLVEVERVDTREPVAALVWRPAPSCVDFEGRDFLRRRYGTHDPSVRYPAYLLVEAHDGLFVGEVNLDTLRGFAMPTTIGRDVLPPLSSGWPRGFTGLASL